MPDLQPEPAKSEPAKPKKERREPMIVTFAADGRRLRMTSYRRANRSTLLDSRRIDRHCHQVLMEALQFRSLSSNPEFCGNKKSACCAVAAPPTPEDLPLWSAKM